MYAKTLFPWRHSLLCSSIIKNGVGIFPDPILRFLYCYQLLALVAFTILEAGSLLMAELLRVLSSWAP